MADMGTVTFVVVFIIGAIALWKGRHKEPVITKGKAPRATYSKGKSGIKIESTPVGKMWVRVGGVKILVDEDAVEEKES